MNVSDDPIILYTVNTAGNVHETATMINTHYPELAQYVLSIEFDAHFCSIVIFKGPRSVFLFPDGTRRL